MTINEPIFTELMLVTQCFMTPTSGCMKINGTAADIKLQKGRQM
jgi:hypothetical protein